MRILSQTNDIKGYHGTIGTPTNMYDYRGERLFVGDVVCLITFGVERLKIRNINYSFRDREYYVYLENDRGSAMCIGYRQLIGYKLFHTLEEAEKALKARGKE